MSVLEIKKFNNPILKKKSREVAEITVEIKELVFDMAETMRKNQGVGLAAPQVGILKRIILVQTDLKKPEISAFINPNILKKSREKEIGPEGCLSFPDIFLDIKRAKEIEVEALDIKGKKVKFKAHGFGARVIQHEIDHLDGILFFQRLGLFQKLKFKLKHPFI